MNITDRVKGWVYLTKSEKINKFLKERFMNYPSRLMPLKLFLNECSIEIGFLPRDFDKHIDVFKENGLIEVENEMIVSLIAKSRLEDETKMKDELKEAGL